MSKTVEFDAYNGTKHVKFQAHGDGSSAKRGSGDSSSSEKLVYANAGTKAADKKNAIPQTLAPNQVSMAAGADGGERGQDINEIQVRAPNTVAEQFPTDGLTRKGHPEDALHIEKLQLADADGVTPFGKLVATDADFKWLQSMREQEAEADFMQWFATNFDMWSPAQKALAKKLWPDFYAQRMKLIDKKLEFMKQIARIKLNGPQSKKDLQLLYALEAGFVDGNELENILHPERARDAQNQAMRQTHYRRGLLNPRARARGDWGYRVREDNSNSIATGSLAVTQPWNLGVSDGFTAFKDIEGNDPTEAEWEGKSQFQLLLNSVNKN